MLPWRPGRPPEVRVRFRLRFKVLDTDGFGWEMVIGLISREEFIAGFEKLRVVESSEVVLKAKLRLSDEESAELQADFDEIDTNKSGPVDISGVCVVSIS